MAFRLGSHRVVARVAVCGLFFVFRLFAVSPFAVGRLLCARTEYPSRAPGVGDHEIWDGNVRTQRVPQVLDYPPVEDKCFHALLRGKEILPVTGPSPAQPIGVTIDGILQEAQYCGGVARSHVPHAVASQTELQKASGGTIPELRKGKT